jgi:hypothetical protein
MSASPVSASVTFPVILPFAGKVTLKEAVIKNIKMVRNETEL